MESSLRSTRDLFEGQDYFTFSEELVGFGNPFRSLSSTEKESIAHLVLALVVESNAFRGYEALSILLLYSRVGTMKIESDLFHVYSKATILEECFSVLFSVTIYS